MNPEYENYKKKRNMTFLNYDKNRHLQLLKNESQENSMELLQYSAFIEGHLDWETKDQYLELVEQFVKEEICISDFLSQFLERCLLNSDAVDFLELNLILLEPNEKSLGFSDFLNDIENICHDFDGDEENAENEFRSFIEKRFLKIQNYLNEF